jgi:hypothetical protein
MDLLSLPFTLMFVGALTQVSLQAQKIAILESKKQPSSKANALIGSGLNFASFLIFLGILLHVLDHYHSLPPQVLKYETYISVFIGAVLVLLGGSILSLPNVDGKVSSMQVVIIGLALSGISIKMIIEGA